jgi:hypothetical protein
MVYYTGHGKIKDGTQRVTILGDKDWPLEVLIRNFKNKHSKNAYLWGIIDSCRIIKVDKDNFDFQKRG